MPIEPNHKFQISVFVLSLSVQFPVLSKLLLALISISLFIPLDSYITYQVILGKHYWEWCLSDQLVASSLVLESKASLPFTSRLNKAFITLVQISKSCWANVVFLFDFGSLYCGSVWKRVITTAYSYVILYCCKYGSWPFTRHCSCNCRTLYRTTISAQIHSTTCHFGFSSATPTPSKYGCATTSYGFSPRASTTVPAWDLPAMTRGAWPSGTGLRTLTSCRLSLVLAWELGWTTGMLSRLCGCGGKLNLCGVCVCVGGCERK